MSLLPFHRFHAFDDPFFFDDFFFDPCFDIDVWPSIPPAPSSYRWVKERERIVHKSTKVTSTTRHLALPPPPPPPPPPEKFRVQVDVDGFSPEQIKTKLEGKLIVEAKQEDRQAGGDFNLREFRKSYELPQNADASRLSSHVTPDRKLVIEVPLKGPETTDRSLVSFGESCNRSLFCNSDFIDSSDFQTRIVDQGSNNRQLQMSIDMKNYRPEEIKVSVKHNQLIVRAEHQHKDGNRLERSSFFKTTTLPQGTKVDQLQSNFFDDGKLKIEAPIC